MAISGFFGLGSFVLVNAAAQPSSLIRGGIHGGSPGPRTFFDAADDPSNLSKRISAYEPFQFTCGRRRQASGQAIRHALLCRGVDTLQGNNADERRTSKLDRCCGFDSR
jgi:hypothetical protein